MEKIMRYKLIKSYPGRPGVGMEVILDDRGQYVSKDIQIFPKDEIEKFPEFWELQKDYEILRFTDGFNIFYKQTNGMFTINTQYIYEEKTLLFKCGKISGFGIYQIKRLSDGEVFTVGDVIGCRDSNHTLTNIFIYKNELRFLMDFQDYLKHKASSYTLNYIKPVKNYRFTTEDGIKIFEGDSYWVVNTKLWTMWKQTARQNTELNKGALAFSKKELAEGYVFFNKKPLFTTEDGVDIYEGDDYYRVNTNWNLATLTMGERFSNSYAGAKFFSTKEAAEEYIDRNKPVFSKNDILIIAEELVGVDQEVINIINTYRKKSII